VGPRVLVAGDFRWDLYEPALCRALRSAGAQVIELRARSLFGPGELLRRAQEKLQLGPGRAAAQAAFVALSALHRPDLAFAWRAPWLGPRAIAAARIAGARKVVLYNNDDPFGPDAGTRLWRAWRRGIPAADLVLAYRRSNLPELKAAGARACALWRSAYDPAVHRPLALTPEEQRRFGCDVVFAGHFEDDGRVALLERLYAAGLSVKIFGTGWEGQTRGRPWEAQGPILPVRGDDYAKALCGARAALVLLSGRNRDLYTRRCFEIPACGVAMLLPRNGETLSLFESAPGAEEALFFDGPDELVAQARRAAADEPLRARVAAAGRARVLRDGHDLPSRAKELLALAGVS
jgi:hypothetical protein